jgi:hypothetical protein
MATVTVDSPRDEEAATMSTPRAQLIDESVTPWSHWVALRATSAALRWRRRASQGRDRRATPRVDRGLRHPLRRIRREGEPPPPALAARRGAGPFVVGPGGRAAGAGPVPDPRSHWTGVAGRRGTRPSVRCRRLLGRPDPGEARGPGLVHEVPQSAAGPTDWPTARMAATARSARASFAASPGATTRRCWASPPPST